MLMPLDPAPHFWQVSAALHDPWATLGVSRSASEKEIKQAHRRLVKQVGGGGRLPTQQAIRRSCRLCAAPVSAWQMLDRLLSVVVGC